MRVHHEAVRIDRDRHVLVVRDLVAGELVELPYDALVLSTGARAVRPPIPGIERALSLRDVEDTDALVAATVGARTAVVVGGGFIGVEVTENLVHLGLDVTLVEAIDQVMAPLDPEMATPVHDRIREHGVDLRLGSGVATIGPDAVTLTSGETVPADLVVAAIGVRPDTTLAQQAGLAVGERGGILVDAQLRTSDPAVYAVGDAVEKTDAVDGSSTLVPLANTANLQGRRVADVIAGLAVRDRPVLGTAIVGVFGLQVATTGWSEKRLRAAGRPYRAIHTHPASHATYYPGADTMALKLLVDPDDRRDPRRPGRRRVRRRQADRRHRHGDHRWAHRERAGRARAGLRAGVLVGQGPGQHARPRGRQPAAGHQCVGPVARARRMPWPPVRSSSTCATRPSAPMPASSPRRSTCR